MIRELSRGDLTQLAQRFAYNKRDPEIVRGDALNQADFLAICHWKAERRHDLCLKNVPEDIERITAASFASNDPLVQVCALTSLHGVGVPTATALLHWGYREGPILDFRAWWTVHGQVRRVFRGADWVPFQARMWAEAEYYDLNIRELDKAVWQFSSENQPT